MDECRYRYLFWSDPDPEYRENTVILSRTSPESFSPKLPDLYGKVPLETSVPLAKNQEAISLAIFGPHKKFQGVPVSVLYPT
jgi:hypothetical protein